MTFHRVSLVPIHSLYGAKDLDPEGIGGRGGGSTEPRVGWDASLDRLGSGGDMVLQAGVLRGRCPIDT